MSNQLAPKDFFAQGNVKTKFEELLGKRAPQFITSILQIVSSSSLLAKADPVSIFNAAATAAVLDLPINPNLGFAYLIPYAQKYKDSNGQWQQKQVAQFQMGYKGFIQLAQRTGLFKTIAATPIYDGQLTSDNPLTGFEFDFSKKKSNDIIGFASYFSLLNGFEKTLFMTVEDMNSHGAKFSKTFSKEDSLWKKDFVGMGNKTVLKLLLSRFAPLSIEMQKAITVDQAVINNETATDVTYIDHEVDVEEPVNKEAERLLLMIKDATKVEDLIMLEKPVKELNDESVTAAYREKSNELA